MAADRFFLPPLGSFFLSFFPLFFIYHPRRREQRIVRGICVSRIEKMGDNKMRRASEEERSQVIKSRVDEKRKERRECSGGWNEGDNFDNWIINCMCKFRMIIANWQISRLWTNEYMKKIRFLTRYSIRIRWINCFLRRWLPSIQAVFPCHYESNVESLHSRTNRGNVIATLGNTVHDGERSERVEANKRGWKRSSFSCAAKKAKRRMRYSGVTSLMSYKNVISARFLHIHPLTSVCWLLRRRGFQDGNIFFHGTRYSRSKERRSQKKRSLDLPNKG